MKLKKKFSAILALLLICSMLLGTASFAEAVEPAEATEAAEVLEAAEAAEEPAAEEASAETETAEWTVMIYLCGTDLETENAMATTNLVEIAATTPNDRVNVVIQTGGTKEWHAQSAGLEIDPNKTQRYHFDENGFTLDEELPLQNMANANTLTEFVQYAAENFPAEKNLLVLWDHGGGSLTGLIVDEKYGRAVMPLDQLEAAVTRAGVSLEAVVLDTCLMASLETAQALQSVAHYLIASEETVPGQGSDYYNWLQYLYDMPECDGRLFGRRVCDSIQQKYAELGYQYNGVTFSVVDLTRLEPVSEAFDEMFAELRLLVDDPAQMRAFSSATNRTENYAVSDMLDLGDLVNRARGLGVSNKTANALLTALADAVVYNVRGVDHSYSTGLSFYYCPEDPAVYADHYARCCKSAEYLAFIDRVNTRWTAPSWVYEEVEYLPDITYENYGVELATEVSEDGVLHLSVTNGLSAVSTIDLVLYAYEDNGSSEDEYEEGTWIRIGHDPFGVSGNAVEGAFTASIAGMIPTLGGEMCAMKVLEENEDYTLCQVPVEAEYFGQMNLLVIYRYGDEIEYSSDEEGATPVYNGAYELLGLQTQSNNELPTRNVYTIAECAGLMIAPVFHEVYFPSGVDNGTITGEAFEIIPELDIENVELPAGCYAAAFSVKDVFGNIQLTEMVPFTWDGETALFEAPETIDAEAEPAA